MDDKETRTVYNLPNILTLSRIVVIPIIFLSVYTNSLLVSTLVAILFAAASITDYFDGYLARTHNQTTIFGRLLDPIADKLLVFSALFVILVKDMVALPISYIPIIIILCREVLVSGLREFLAEVRVGMPVTRLAQWKTGFQMFAIGGLLFRDSIFVFGVLGEILLWIAGVLTFITGYQYFQKSIDYVKKVENGKKNPAPKKVPGKVPAKKKKKK